MSDRDNKPTPTGSDLERLAAELDGEDTRPEIRDAEERRQKRRRELRDSVRNMVAVGAVSAQKSTAERVGDLETRALIVEADQKRLSQRLVAVEQRERAMSRELAEIRRLLMTDRGSE